MSNKPYYAESRAQELTRSRRLVLRDLYIVENKNRDVEARPGDIVRVIQVSPDAFKIAQGTLLEMKGEEAALISSPTGDPEWISLQWDTYIEVIQRKLPDIQGAIAVCYYPEENREIPVQSHDGFWYLMDGIGGKADPELLRNARVIWPEDLVG